MERILAINDEYNGQYVALKSSEDDTVIAASEDPEDALNMAREKGVENPIIFYVPDKDMVHIY